MANYEFISIIITITFILSLSITAISIPFINNAGKNFAILDFPNERKHHKVPLVRLGGIGIILGCWISYFIVYFWLIRISFIDSSSLSNLIIISSTLFFLIGISDDLFKLKPITKLIFQFLVSSYLYLAGINFNTIEFYPSQNINNSITLSSIFSYLITVFLIVGLTNGFNWLDGLDGLASGISFIVCLSLGIIFINKGQFNLALISCSLAGSIAGFLRYNIYPAKILMGDCGSYLLGGTLSTLSIVGLRKSEYLSLVNNNSFDNLQVLPIYMIFLLFLIPIVDMIQVIVLRVKDGKLPFYPDRRHLHHKLLLKGINERNVTIILYTLTQLSACLALLLFDIKGKIILICLSLIFLFCAILYCFNIKSKIDPNYKNR